VFSVFPPKSAFTYLVYFNSIFQAVSTYYMTVMYDGWPAFWKSFSLNSFIYGPQQKIDVKDENASNKVETAQQPIEPEVVKHAE